MINKFFIVLIILISLGCTSGVATSKTAVLVEATIITIPTRGAGAVADRGSGPRKELDREVNLPNIIWSDFEYRRIAAGRGFAQTQAEFCVVEGDGVADFKEGTKVEILEEARCMNVLHQNEGKSPSKYVIGLTKVKILDSGAIGWTWSKSVSSSSQ